MSTARATLLLGLALVATACASAPAKPPVGPAEAQAFPPSRKWRTLSSPRLGFSITVPPGATIGKEGHGPAAGGDSDLSSVVVSLGDDRTLFVGRTDLRSRAAARIGGSFAEEVRRDFTSIDREDDGELGGLPALVLEGVSGDEQTQLWMTARGASFYTVAVSGPIEAETKAVADRVVASFRVVPSPQIRLSVGRTYAATVPEIAFDLPTPVPDLEGATARVYGLDADSSDALVVIEMPLGEGALDGGQDALFERSLRGIASSGAQIDGVRPIEVAGLPGREVRKQSGGAYSVIRMILTGDRLFVAGVTSRDKSVLDRPDSRLFLESFRPIP